MLIIRGKFFFHKSCQEICCQVIQNVFKVNVSVTGTMQKKLDTSVM